MIRYGLCFVELPRADSGPTWFGTVYHGLVEFLNQEYGDREAEPQSQ